METQIKANIRTAETLNVSLADIASKREELAKLKVELGRKAEELDDLQTQFWSHETTTLLSNYE